MHTFSKKDAFRFGWDTFKANPWIYIGATAFIMFISIVLKNITRGHHGLFSFIIGVVATLLEWWLYMGLTRMTLRAYDGGKPDFKMLFGEKWETLWRYALAMIVTGIIVIVGLVLLIVPGIIAQVALCLVMFLVLEKGAKPLDAIKESYNLTKGYRWELFLFFLLILLLNLAGAIVVFVGLLVTVPITLLAMVHVYKDIVKNVQIQPATPIAMGGATIPPAAL